jgi:dipeptidyl-peptidase-3
VLRGYLASFETGDLHAYRAAQRAWVRDITPRVESVLGFVEPYRDPAGVRGEFEGIVGVVDAEGEEGLARIAGGMSGGGL